MVLDILNLTNANNRLQESDRSGPAFNLGLPLEIEAPRFVRFSLKYHF